MKFYKQTQVASTEVPSLKKVISIFEHKSDTEIWDAFRKGDGKAFNLIYCRYFNQLFSYGHQFTRDRELVKDTVQDLFIYLRTHREKLGSTDSIKFYLYRSLRRSLSRKLNRKKDLYYVSQETLPDFEINLSKEALLIEEESMALQKSQLQKAMNQLTKRQKEAVLYFYYEGFSYEQIANIMEFSKVEYARKLIYRAVSAMKEHLQKEVVLSDF